MVCWRDDSQPSYQVCCSVPIYKESLWGSQAWCHPLTARFPDAVTRSSDRYQLDSGAASRNDGLDQAFKSPGRVG